MASPNQQINNRGLAKLAWVGVAAFVAFKLFGGTKPEKVVKEVVKAPIEVVKKIIL